jgi:glycosyltransferase involved in cell wall biosynthesis
VSCIVPAFNSERFIGEALESILRQRAAPAEMIVVDDGSTDGTAAIVAGFGNRVQYVRQPTSGPAATRNAGIAASRGEFIAFLDADDRWHDEKLERQLACLAADQAIGVCVGRAQNFWAEELAHEQARLQEHPRARPIPAYVSGAMLARRGVFERVGPFDSGLWFADAADWFVRARRLGVRVHALPEVLLYHRMHRGNISRRMSRESKSEFINVVRGVIHRRPPG